MRALVITFGVLLGCGRADAQPPTVMVPSPSVSAAAAPAPAASVPEAAPSKVDTADWKRSDEGPFSFLLPSDFTREKVQGIDSLVGKFVSTSKAVIAYDYGRYSNQLGELDSHAELNKSSFDSQGATALLVTARDSAQGAKTPGYIVAATWRTIPGAPSTRLTIYCTTPRAADRERLEAVLRSVKLTPRSP